MEGGEVTPLGDSEVQVIQTGRDAAVQISLHRHLPFAEMSSPIGHRQPKSDQR